MSATWGHLNESDRGKVRDFMIGKMIQSVEVRGSFSETGIDSLMIIFADGTYIDIYAGDTESFEDWIMVWLGNK